MKTDTYSPTSPFISFVSEGETTMNNQTQGFSGWSVFFAFLGGVAAGAVAAVLSQARNRQAAQEFAQTQIDRAKRVPGALREAGTAAAQTFTEAVTGNNAASRVPAAH